MLPKTAIIGAHSLLGKAFLQSYRQLHPDFVATGRRALEGSFSYLDLASPDVAALKLSATGHRDALIFAGISKISTCQAQEQLAKQVNGEGTLILIKQLVQEGIKPIFFSSDQVFDGVSGNYQDDAVLNPLNKYGKLKADVERQMKEICQGKYLIVRLGKIFTLEKGSGTILDEMAATLHSGANVRAADDQIFTLTYLDDIVQIVMKLQERNACGVYNVCSPELWSRYDLAVNMAERLGFAKERVEKISLDGLGESFPRPKNTTMRIEKLRKMVDYQFTPITQCMDKIAVAWKSHSRQLN